MQSKDLVKLVELFYSQDLQHQILDIIYGKEDVLSTVLRHYKHDTLFGDDIGRKWQLKLRGSIDEPVLLGLTKDTPTFYLPQVRGIIIQGFRVKMGYQNQEEVPF